MNFSMRRVFFAVLFLSLYIPYASASEQFVTSKGGLVIHEKLDRYEARDKNPVQISYLYSVWMGLNTSEETWDKAHRFTLKVGKLSEINLPMGGDHWLSYGPMFNQTNHRERVDVSCDSGQCMLMLPFYPAVYGLHGDQPVELSMYDDHGLILSRVHGTVYMRSNREAKAFNYAQFNAQLKANELRITLEKPNKKIRVLAQIIDAKGERWLSKPDQVTGSTLIYFIYGKPTYIAALIDEKGNIFENKIELINRSGF